MRRAHQFEQNLTIQAVDETNSVIRGVGMITEGPVLGHEDPTLGQPLAVDSVTLQQVMASAQTYTNGLRVNADHGSGVLSAIGYLDNFAIDGITLRADFHVFDSEPNKAKIFEMANTMPDCFGFSVSFIGDDEICGNQVCTRCDEIFSCDLVTEPAACPTGLFARRRVDAGVRGRMAIQTAPKAAPSGQKAPAAAGAPDNSALPSLSDMAAAHKQLMGDMKAHLARFAKLEASVAALSPGAAPDAPLPSEGADENSNDTTGSSAAAEDAVPLPFSSGGEIAPDPAVAGDGDGNVPAIAKPGIPKRVTPATPAQKVAASRNAELREMGRTIASEIAKQFAAKLGQSPVAAAAPGASTDHADGGEKPEDKFVASAQKHFKAGKSKLQSLSAASAEQPEGHRAFINSQHKLELKRD